MRTVTIPVLGGLVLSAALVCCAAGPNVPAADKEQAVNDNNAFAFDLYGKLRDREGNLFFSPESISTALALAYAGAQGETAQEMASTLHFTLPPDRLHPALGALLAGLNAGGAGHNYQLRIANALWGQKGHAFLPSYLTLLKDDYGAPLQEVDFRGATEKAREDINAWVSQQTKDKIKDLLEPGSVGPDTRLVLTNAVYFKGDWATPFKKDLTRPGPFHLGPNEAADVPLMHQTTHFKYLDAGTFQALALPYAGKDLEMVVLLPKKVDGLTGLEKALTAEALDGWLAKMRTEEVVVTLPRFQLTSKFELAPTLAAMGMKRAFTDAADFSGMDGKKDLALSAVIHQAYVNVNEEGTEAAAATGVVARATAARVNPVFRADHPFLFLIRDTHTGGILFLGRLVRPSA
jgi:serpin B